LSFLFAVFFIVFHAKIWHIQVRSLGLKANTYRIIAGSLVSNPGKYLPGKIWTVMGRAYFLSKEGNPPSVCSSVALLSQIVSIISSLICLLVLAPFFLHKDHQQWTSSSIILVISLLVFSYPNLFFKFTNWILRKFQKPEINIQLHYTRLLYWIGLTFFAGLISGSAFSLFVLSILEVSLIDVPVLIGAHALAGVVGLLAILTPGGLGVREGVLFIILPSYIGVEATIFASFGYRLVITFAEFLCAGIAWIVLNGNFFKP